MTLDDTNRSDLGYPARLEIDYPERSSRAKTLFRIILAIPILVLLAVLGGSLGGINTSSEVANSVIVAFLAAGGFLFVPLLLTLLFRRKYPRW